VVICNTGQYGHSVVFSPFAEPYKRIIYRHQGNNLFSHQLVELPVRDLDAAQRGQKGFVGNNFKGLPPGYEKNSF
jgi:hypothetical protein